MPRLSQFIAALRQYRRYKTLSAYIDDVDDLRDGSLLLSENLKLFRAPPNPIWHLVLDEGLVAISVVPAHGLVRLRLARPSPTTTAPSSIHSALLLELDAVIGASVTAASQAKQGQLADLVLCMMIGNHVGTAAGPVGLRIFAIHYDGATDRWRAYDGTLLSWAKEHLAPETA